MSTTTKQRLDELTIALIDPDPHNRTAIPDADFVASIKKHGVIEPIIVIEHPNTDGRYMIVAGERRWRGSTKAGLNTIPAIVRHDLDETSRIELAVIENLQRDDVPIGQQAMQLLRLVNVGHTSPTLAKAIGRKQKWVGERLKLAELPKSARTLLDSGDWTIATGLDAVKLLRLNHEAIEDLLVGNDSPTPWQVQAAVRQAEFTVAAVKLVRKAQNAKIAVVDSDATFTPLDDLGIEPGDHESLECHAVTLGGNPSYGKAHLKAACTNPKSHRPKGDSPVKIIASTTPSSNPHGPRTEADKAHTKAKRDAKTARHEAMAAVLSMKIPKADAIELVLDELIDTANATQAKKAATLLNLELPDDVYGCKQVLVDHASTTAGNKLQAALTIAMLNRDEGVDMASWNDDRRARTKTWFAWLAKTTAFIPSTYDRTQTKENKL